MTSSPYKPVYIYPDGYTPVVKKGVIALSIPGFDRGRDVQFSVENNSPPALPLQIFGELWHQGWDIPTLWAVDADNQCWADNAHGHALEPCRAEVLIGSFEGENDRAGANRIRKTLGLAEQEPAWMEAARAAGWTPPKEK